ncbi:MAG: diguanylate cyclase [Betaproteobacteria bacterium]|nr:diguanylate cyclase [Betaproteobacteria bacterium]
MAEADNPTVIARETLRVLATRRLAPTPENYRKIYAEIGGQAASEPLATDRLLSVVAPLSARHPDDQSLGALVKSLQTGDAEGTAAALQAFCARGSRTGGSQLGTVFRETLRQIDAAHRGWTVARKRDGVDRVLGAAPSDEALAVRLQNLVRSWQENPAGALPLPDAPPADGLERVPAAATFPVDPALSQARELLAATLENGLAPRLERYSDVYSELFQIAWRIREAELPDDWNRVGQQLKQYWLKVELRVEPDEELIDNLMRLLALVVDNLDELVEDDQWVQGQVAVLRELISKPVDLRAVREAERGFKEVIFKQSQLKSSLSDAKSTLKSLLSVFIERLGEVTGTTVEYHQKIERYSERIASTESIDSLKTIVEELMLDTRSMQVDMLRSRDDLLAARQQAELASRRVRQLETELEQVSEKVREDQLTGTLNRRGLDDAMTREIARAQRTGKPMCIALLDLDNFKRLNDTYGHSAGDAALVHLARVIRRTVRPTDLIARFGGEEFVIILSETDLDNALAITTRLQRELTKRFFLHDNERVLITFSAGVAQYVKGETDEAFLERADRAMYEAKHQGKNRVVPAN